MVISRETVASTLTHKNNVTLEKEFETKVIMRDYQNAFSIDVSRLFDGVEKIQLYRCNQTGYRFFYPLHIAGDSQFYEELQRFPWYYMDWKWEHATVQAQIGTAHKILEIGCAKGAFIEKLSNDGLQCTGLEFNEDAIDVCLRKGLDVRSESIQSHAKRFPDCYDIVCSFQVMEHIAPIGEVLEASINTLKKGGRLFISVPNNKSFLGYDWNILNLPPHHMGLWDKPSLKNIEKAFPELKVKNFFFEPLQGYHVEYYNRVFPKIRKEFEKKYVRRFGLVGKILNKIMAKITDKQYASLHPTLENYTVIAEYIKK